MVDCLYNIICEYDDEYGNDYEGTCSKWSKTIFIYGNHDTTVLYASKNTMVQFFEWVYSIVFESYYKNDGGDIDYFFAERRFIFLVLRRLERSFLVFLILCFPPALCMGEAKYSSKFLYSS